MPTPIEKVYSIRLAVQGENATTPIEIDMTTWAEEFPNASFYILFKPYNTTDVVPVITEYEDHILRWVPTIVNTAIAGVGYTEVRAIDSDTGLIKKSRIIPTSVENSVSGYDGIEPPSPATDWVNAVLESKNAAENAANTAIAQTGIIDQVILIQDEEPTAEHNKLYIKKTPSEAVEVATEEELAALRTEVQGDLAEIQDDVQGVETDVASLQTDVQGVESNVATLQTDVQGLNEDLLEVQQQASEGVKFTSQNLTDAQKTQARENIGAADQEDVADLKSQFPETKEVVNLLLGNYEIISSANLYDASLQTPDTISPHYYVNGVPYSSTSFDNSWNCTAMFSIEPGTQYTIGLVPAVVYNHDAIVKPWHSASHGIFFYNSEGAYISGSSNNTFTTPNNAKYARFNYYKAVDIVSLSVLNSRCMLVKGDTLPATYQEYGDRLESDLQDQINSIDVGFEWKFSGNDLLLGYGYNATHDAVIVLNEGRANGLFDFSKFALKPKGMSLSGLETANLITVWNASTDMHGPFQFNAVNNADGYHSDNINPGFVGGNHTLDQLGADFKTASSKYVMYFADGRPVSSGYGKATHFEIRWANDVQAYNTVKEGGGGRVCLIEFHDMIFDGVQFSEIVKLVPLEDINMRLWYGFEFVSWGDQYTNLRFLDGANRGVYTSGDVNSGNIITSGIEAYGDEHMIVLTVDIDFDLGKRELVNSGYFGALTSGFKGYLRIITKGATFVMNSGDAYYLRGTWRFYPAISTGD